MKQGTFFFTSESVSEGHPDKISDRISDAILDRFLTVDPINSRLGCETFCTTNRIVVGGVDHVRGPEFPGEFEFPGLVVHRDNARSTRDSTPLEGREAHPPRSR